jgi:hypothetical protein
VSNGLNLAITLPAALEGLNGQNASAQASTALFSAILMQQMNTVGIDLPGDADPISASNQGFTNSASLVKLVPALLAQSKDRKPALATGADPGQAATPAMDPVLSMWIAAIVAAQPQLTGIEPKSLPQDALSLEPQIELSSKTLQALQKQFPELTQSSKDAHVQVVKIQSEKPDQKNELNFAPIADFGTAGNEHIVDTPVSPAPAITAQKPDSEQPSLLSDTSPSSKGNGIRGARVKGIEARPDLPGGPLTSPPPQSNSVSATNQSGESKSPGQDSSHADQNRSNTDQRKDSSSANQFQPVIEPSKNTTAFSGIEQASIGAVAMASANVSSINAQTVHTSTAHRNEPLNLREAGSVVAADPTPRIAPTARLMEAAGQAEMRVSMKTENSGSVDVRAVLQGDHLSATVAAQHGGTRDWLMANLHELHASLSKDDLNLRTFEVTDSSLRNDSHGGQSGEEKQQQGGGAYATHSYGGRDTAPSTLDDLDLNEEIPQALSLLA